MSNMTPEKSGELRKPFPKSAVGKLPKAGMMLDYVGHAAVTDRLLAVDPGWTWEPFALDDRGLPALDKAGNLWIRLTVCGITRIGVGDGKSAKEIVGDALRNAAMRFGVALDLWSKEELEHSDPDQVSEPPAPKAQRRDPEPPARVHSADLRSEKQSKMLAVQLREAGLNDRDTALKYLSGLVGRELTTTKELTVGDASVCIDALVEANKKGIDPITGVVKNYGGEDPWG